MSARPPRMSPGTTVLVVVLLLVPCAALAVVPLYSHETPSLWGFPFFYWYQIAWVILTPILTVIAYVLVKRARRQK